MPRLTTNETSQQPVNVEASAMNEENVSNDIPQLNNERMPQESAIHETNNVYIVGGFVRDSIIGRKNDDFDLCMERVYFCD